MERALALRDKIDLLAGLHAELLDAMGDHRDIFLSISLGEAKRTNYSLPEESLLDITSVIEKHLTIFQKEFRKL